MRWKAKANGRDGFIIWRRADSYDLSRPLCTPALTPVRGIAGATAFPNVDVITWCLPLRSESSLSGDYEVTKRITQDIPRPRFGTARYCYSVWAWARRIANDLQLGYYGGPLTQEKLRSKEICTDPISSTATGVTSLSVDSIAVASQQHGKALKFDVIGQGIEGIFVSIFDLSGRKVFDSGEVQGNTLAWNLQNNAGQPLANGVYLYVMRVRGVNEAIYVSEVRKLVILR